MDILFKKYKTRNKILENQLSDRSITINKLNRKNLSLESQLEYLNRNINHINNLTNFSMIIGQEMVDNEIYFVTLREGSEIRLENEGTKINYPVVYFKEIHSNDGYKKKLKILDIFSRILEDKGLGSVLLSYLNKYAKNNNFYSICGELSPQDSADFDKLEHFYKKNKYEVNFNKNRTSGVIKKIITK